VAEIAELAEANALWCHVDSCVGGFIIPFLKKLGRDIPDFDFNIPGVHSISADLHKYGYTPPGMSTFSLRNRADQRYQIFDWKSSQWGGAGDYMTETLAGSRATDVLASAWTTMMMLGEEGYLKAARGLLETMELMKAGISAIDGLEVAFEPEVALFLFTSRQYDIVAVAEEMTARGYPTAWYELDHPVIHLLLDPLEDERQLEDYLETLTAVARDVADGKVKRSGEGAVYA
jgi:glutamate/tyrosine decarboxylase-like PLP-dependent enzyme